MARQGTPGQPWRQEHGAPQGPESGAALLPRASLVPVFSFGENELFQQLASPLGSWVPRAQKALQPLLSVALPLFHGPWASSPCGAPIHAFGEPRLLPHLLPGPPAPRAGRWRSLVAV